jgi:hypothetical protein
LLLYLEPAGELPLDAVSCERCGQAMNIMGMKPGWFEESAGKMIHHKAVYELECPDGHELLQEAPSFVPPSPPVAGPRWIGNL